MDPLTAALMTLNTLLTFGMKIWDSMSQEQKTAGADDWGKFTHNLAAPIIDLQARIVAKLPPTQP